MDVDYCIISTGRLRYLYDQAKGFENLSHRFWNAILNDHFPGHENWIVSPEQYVHLNDLRQGKDRMDTYIEYFDEQQYINIGIMLHEAKREAKSAKDLEKQALRYAKAVTKDRGLARIYVLTTMGVRFRVWSFNYGERSLQAMFDGSVGQAEYYIDADSAEGSTEFWNFVDTVKKSLKLFYAPTLPSQAHLLGDPSVIGGEDTHDPILVYPKFNQQKNRVEFDYCTSDGEKKKVKTSRDNFVYDDTYGALAWYSNDYDQQFIADTIAE